MKGVGAGWEQFLRNLVVEAEIFACIPPPTPAIAQIEEKFVDFVRIQSGF